MKRSICKAFLLFIAFFGIYCLGQAQTKSQDDHPIVTHGPYLVAPAETGITVVWTTDIPAHGKVIYGTNKKLGQVAEPVEHGMVPVDTLHTVRLTGLKPGQKYYYRIISTGVTKLKPYWPEKTKGVRGEIYSFTTTNSKASNVIFSFITDTQYEDLPRLNNNLDLVDWESIDFLVHGGDALGWVRNEHQLFKNFIDPVMQRLEHHKPLIFVRGNHDTRGPYARKVYEHLPTGTGEFYYAFDAGPLHLIVLDTGEDKPDTTTVYSGLNRFEPYRQKEKIWFKKHLKENERARDAPFTVVLMHQPQWGAVKGKKAAWTKIANGADIDLVIAGHWHQYAWVKPGKWGNKSQCWW